MLKAKASPLLSLLTQEVEVWFLDAVGAWVSYVAWRIPFQSRKGKDNVLKLRLLAEESRTEHEDVVVVGQAE